MKTGDGRGLQTGRWVANQLLRSDDINFLANAEYDNATTILAAIASPGVADGSSPDIVVSGLLLEHSTAMTCMLRAGAAVSFQGKYLSGDDWGFVSDPGAVFSVIVPQDEEIAFATGGAQDRIDSLEIRPVQNNYNQTSRQFQDPITGIVTSALTNTRMEIDFEFAIREGTEAASPVAPSRTAGWIKVAEVTVAAGASSITDSEIATVANSASWTADISTTELRNEPLFRLSLEIVDSLSSIYSNNWELSQKVLSGSADWDKTGIGISVSPDGSLLAIGQEGIDDGSSYNQGNVVVYERLVDGSWGNPTTIDSPDPPLSTSGNNFGASVSITNTHLAVGAPNWETGGGFGMGKVYVFERTGPNTWGNVVGFTRPAGNANLTDFGIQVQIDDTSTYLAVADDNSSPAIWIWERTGSNSWGNVFEVIISGRASNDSVHPFSLETDRLIVGNSQYESDSRGRAYLLERTGTNTWGNQVVIDNPNTETNANFGSGVAWCGNYAIIGEQNNTIDGIDDPGSVHIYGQVNGTWTLVQTINCPYPTTNGTFGDSLIAGDKYIAIASQEIQYDTVSVTQPGPVYVYRVRNPSSYAPVDTENFQMLFPRLSYEMIGSYQRKELFMWNDEELIVSFADGDDPAGERRGVVYSFKETMTQKTKAFQTEVFNRFNRA